MTDECKPNVHRGNPLPQGAPAETLLKFMGTISPEDAKEMLDFINSWCERIDDEPPVQFPNLNDTKIK